VVGAVALMRPREWGGLGPSVSVHSDSGGRVDRSRITRMWVCQTVKEAHGVDEDRSPVPSTGPTVRSSGTSIPFHHLLARFLRLGCWPAAHTHTHLEMECSADNEKRVSS
jgi:hypothetical protein